MRVLYWTVILWLIYLCPAAWIYNLNSADSWSDAFSWMTLKHIEVQCCVMTLALKKQTTSATFHLDTPFISPLLSFINKWGRVKTHIRHIELFGWEAIRKSMFFFWPIIQCCNIIFYAFSHLIRFLLLLFILKNKGVSIISLYIFPLPSVAF